MGRLTLHDPSGTTTGVTKYIPLSEKMRAANVRAAIDVLVHHLANRPKTRILAGRNFMLGGSTDLKKHAENVWSGDLSGIAAANVPWWARRRYFPPREVALMSDCEAKVERMAIHDASLDGQSLLACPRREEFEHDGRLICRQHVCAQAGRGDAQRAASGGHIQEPHARTEADPAKALAAQPHLRRGVGPVVARRDSVPRDLGVVLQGIHHEILLAARRSRFRRSTVRRNLKVALRRNHPVGPAQGLGSFRQDQP